MKRLEDGLFRYRKPPNGSWIDNFDPEKYPGAVYHAKGLIPVFKPKGETITLTPIPDLMEIGAIDYLREKKRYFEAISISSTHTEFQGKRILQLMKKENKFTSDEQKIIKEICKKNRSNRKRIGVWSFKCLVEVLYNVNIISKEEYVTLTKLRTLRNQLLHTTHARYQTDPAMTDELLKSIVQVLLRIRELPFPLNITLRGNEMKQFWRDLGYSEYI